MLSSEFLSGLSFFQLGFAYKDASAAQNDKFLAPHPEQPSWEMSSGTEKAGTVAVGAAPSAENLAMTTCPQDSAFCVLQSSASRAVGVYADMFSSIALTGHKERENRNK